MMMGIEATVKKTVLRTVFRESVDYTFVTRRALLKRGSWRAIDRADIICSK